MSFGPVDPDFEDVELSDEEVALEIDAYRARHLAEHSSQLGPQEIFRLIEQEGFLADQVESLGSYAEAGRTLARMALPYARGDRFLLYAATGLALQQLATRLDDEATARAILHVGRHGTVAGLADQLARPLDRARVWALLAAAGTAQESAAYCRLIVPTVDSYLESPASILEDEDRDCLRLIVLELAGALRAAWAHWQRSPLLPEAFRELLRLDYVEGMWLAGGWRDVGVLAEAVRCPSLEALARRLAALLAGRPEEVEVAGDFVEAWRREDPSRSWKLASRVGSAWAATRGDLARCWWRRVVRQAPPPPELLDGDALDWLRQLAREDLLPLRSPALAPTPRAMVALALASRDPASHELAEAREAVEALTVPAERFLGVLYLALAALPADARLARRWLRAAGDALEKAGYRAEPALLLRYLRTMAVVAPKSLRRELQEIVFAPGFTAEDLLELAAGADRPALWRDLFESAERFALAVSASQLAAFELRSRLLHRLGQGLLELEGGLDLLDSLTARQLLEEEESLRLELATRLLRAGREEEARKLAGRLADGPVKRLADLRLMAGGRPQELEAAGLFAALFDLSSIEDELWGLRALLETPLDLEEIFERVLARIVHPDTRSLFVLLLVQHRAAFEQRCFGKLRDPTSLLELARPLLVIEDERRLAALVPELVRTGLLAGRKVALAELLESAEGLMRLPALDPRDRLEAFEQMILTSQEAGQEVAAPFLTALTRLPSLLEEKDQDRAREFRLLLPRVVATLESAEGKEGAKGAAAHRWLARLGPGWRLDEDPWPEILAFCRADAGSRRERVAGWPARSVPPELLESAALLLARQDAELALGLLRRFPAGAARQRLTARLVLAGVVPAASLPAALLLIEDEARQRSLLAHAHRESGDDAFLENLADAAAHGNVDSRDPADLPILRRLWRCPPEASEEKLGPAVGRAFRQGPETAERALRVWLHGVLGPRPGEGREALLERLRLLQEAAARARSLDYGVRRR